MSCRHCNSEITHLLENDPKKIICQTCGKFTDINWKKPEKKKPKIQKKSKIHRSLLGRKQTPEHIAAVLEGKRRAKLRREREKEEK